MVAQPVVAGSEAPPRTVSVEVAVAGACFLISALAAALVTVPSGEPRPALRLLGWPLFALVGATLLDARPGHRTARVLTALALFPVVVLGTALARYGTPTSEQLAHVVAAWTPWQALAALTAIPWATSATGRRAVGLVALAGAGAGVATVGETADVAGAKLVGWTLLLAGCAGTWTATVRAARDRGRVRRRRVAWIVILLASSSVGIGAAWLVGQDALSGYLTSSVLIGGVLAVGRLCLLEEFRPAVDHLLDAALALAATAATAFVVVLVWLGGRLARLPSPATFAAFTAVLGAALVLPVALWVRRTTLARRYGSGTIPPSAVATLTADLHARADARDLLSNAATIVAAASGSRAVRIVLGAEVPQLPDGWVLHALTVGQDRVGALLVDSGSAEGPELRQRRVIEQLRPTVALVARAVGLAVEAEHARRDVARERDAERRRILQDLHDGLGPVLAGMSMQVQAALRRSPPSAEAGLLSELATGLTVSRGDLRRLVSGITPSVLEDGDLQRALDQLVASFSGVAAGPRIRLEGHLDTSLARSVQVAVYRCVAEGLTNALRHSGARTVTVSMRTADERVVVDVVDDGAGGRIVPGVGLSSLLDRARGLNGCLEVGPHRTGGTRLHLELPVGGSA